MRKDIEQREDTYRTDIYNTPNPIDQLHGVFGGNFKVLIKRIFFSTNVNTVLRQKRLDHAKLFMKSTIVYGTG